MTCRNFLPKIHQQYFTPTALSSFHLPFLALPETLDCVHDDENYSYQFELHDKNRKLCLCLLPFINIKGKNCPERWQKRGTGEEWGDKEGYTVVLCMWCLRCFIYEFHQHSRALPAVKQNPKTCEIKVLVRFPFSPLSFLHALQTFKGALVDDVRKFP